MSDVKNMRLFSCLFILFILVLSTQVIASSVKEVRFKGWFDTEFRGNDTSGNRPYFDIHHLYLISEITLEENFSGLIEIEVEHSPKTSTNKGDVILERLYIKKKLSSQVSIRVGKFNTPFGYWAPTHWSILVETISRPIHESNHYIPAKSVGIETIGILFTKNNEIEWKLFFSNGSESEGTNKPEDQSFGGGGDLRFTFSEGNSFIGVSYYNQKNPQFEGRTENSVVGYAGTKFGKFDFKGEYISQTRSIGNSNTIYDDIETYYISGKYNVNLDFAFGSRYDFGDDEKLNINEKHHMTSLFLNWTPIPEIIGKLEYDLHRFDMPIHRDFNEWAIYLGLIF